MCVNHYKVTFFWDQLLKIAVFMKISSEWRIKQTISNEVTIFRIMSCSLESTSLSPCSLRSYSFLTLLFNLFVCGWFSECWWSKNITAGEQCSNRPQGTWSVRCTDHSCRIPSNCNWAQQHMDLNIYLFNLIAWRRLAVLSWNIAIHWDQKWPHHGRNDYISLLKCYLPSW